jgi:hypothetical protein
MRLHIKDTHTLPRATPYDLQRAFDGFEQVIADNLMLARYIGDLDIEMDLGQRQITFNGFIERPDGEWPRYYAQEAQMRMGQFARAFMAHFNLPRSIAERRTDIRAADGSFAAVGELKFTVPAP